MPRRINTGMNVYFQSRRRLRGIAGYGFAVVAALATPPCALASSAKRIEPYLLASPSREIALARSAAPPSISRPATILVLKPQGYVAVVRGMNGFVCLVERSWDNRLNAKRTRFWNPRSRFPFCFNPAGARSILPRYLRRTRWVMAGATRRQIRTRQRADWTEGVFKAPEPGAMSYMMSKEGRGVGGLPGPWRPHLMFYFQREEMPDWGANLPGGPIYVSARTHTAVFYVLVPVWSDGSLAPAYR